MVITQGIDSLMAVCEFATRAEADIEELLTGIGEPFAKTHCMPQTAGISNSWDGRCDRHADSAGQEVPQQLP
eukprot:COSAG02_NODE_39726_length_413_cov_1.302548_2_plen_72_part_00